jgi:nucleoside recognition membrane protein YjiH
MAQPSFVGELNMDGKLTEKHRTRTATLFSDKAQPTAAEIHGMTFGDAITIRAVGFFYKASTGSNSALRASFFKGTGTAILATISENRSTAGQYVRRKATISGTNKSIPAGTQVRVKFPTVGASVKGGVNAWIEYTVD